MARERVLRGAALVLALALGGALGCGGDDSPGGPQVWTCQCVALGITAHADVCSEADPGGEAKSARTGQSAQCTCTATGRACVPDAGMP